MSLCTTAHCLGGCRRLQTQVAMHLVWILRLPTTIKPHPALILIFKTVCSILRCVFHVVWLFAFFFGGKYRQLLNSVILFGFCCLCKILTFLDYRWTMVGLLKSVKQSWIPFISVRNYSTFHLKSSLWCQSMTWMKLYWSLYHCEIWLESYSGSKAFHIVRIFVKWHQFLSSTVDWNVKRRH